jgi:ferritin-like metal-binding protein YciE
MSVLGKKSKQQVDLFKKRVSDLKELKQKIERLTQVLNEKTKILKSQSCEYSVRLSSKFEI